MLKHDGEEAIVGLILGLVVFFLIVYLVVILATVIAGGAAIGGTIFGGSSAIKNYILSFKENIIDSNKVPKMTA